MGAGKEVMGNDTRDVAAALAGLFRLSAVHLDNICDRIGLPKPSWLERAAAHRGEAGLAPTGGVGGPDGGEAGLATAGDHDPVKEGSDVL